MLYLVAEKDWFEIFDVGENLIVQYSEECASYRRKMESTEYHSTALSTSITYVPNR